VVRFTGTFGATLWVSCGRGGSRVGWAGGRRGRRWRKRCWDAAAALGEQGRWRTPCGGEKPLAEAAGAGVDGWAAVDLARDAQFLLRGDTRNGGGDTGCVVRAGRSQVTVVGP